MLYLFIKKNKQLINNYRSVSMLLIFGKIFERNIFDNIYGYEYNLLNPNQRQSHKMVKHTLTISRQFADEMFECV